MEFDNLANQDTLYFGCVNQDGSIIVFNQDGEKIVRSYTPENLLYLIKNIIQQWCINCL